ncbi:MAG: hypothetical protein WCP55_06310 [Lentisphaerota bacterium]
MNLDIIVSKEGSSDMGNNSVWDEKSGSFIQKKGSMLILLEMMIESHSSSCKATIVERNELSRYYKTVKRFNLKLPGSKFGRAAGHINQAASLGFMAIEKRSHIAVYFHDCDYTRSAPSYILQQFIDAVEAGFKESAYKAGVPMIPKPCSEAWLLALSENSSKGSNYYENLPGNLSAKRDHAKDLLENAGYNNEEKRCLLVEKSYSKNKLDTYSFNNFKNKLDAVVTNIMAKNA